MSKRDKKNLYRSFSSIIRGYLRAERSYYTRAMHRFAFGVGDDEVVRLFDASCVPNVDSVVMAYTIWPPAFSASSSSFSPKRASLTWPASSSSLEKPYSLARSSMPLASSLGSCWAAWT